MFVMPTFSLTLKEGCKLDPNIKYFYGLFMEYLWNIYCRSVQVLAVFLKISAILFLTMAHIMHYNGHYIRFLKVTAYCLEMYKMYKM